MPAWWSIPTARATSSRAASSRRVSWTLKEQVKLDAEGIASRDWESYPILRFSEVPEMQAELVDGAGQSDARGRRMHGRPDRRRRSEMPSRHALGVRIHDMPLTRERIMAALLKT